MDTLITQLNQKYERYKKNLYENENIDAPKYIFDCAYDYLCITENQPKVKEILEKSRLDLEKKKEEIIKRNHDNETQKQFIENAEFDSLFFCYNEVFNAVYIPMSKYKNAQNPLSEKDITGNISIYREWFLDGMNSFVIPIAKLLSKLFPKKFQIRKDVEMYKGLQKMTYDFKRPKYPKYMEQIHTLLIPELLKLCTEKPEVVAVKNSQINIFINQKKGIYREIENDKILAYKIKIPSNRFTFIDLLFGKEKVKTSVLAEAVGYTEELVRKEIVKTNDLFTDRLEINDPLILKVGTGGYSLNTEIFNIVKN